MNPKYQINVLKNIKGLAKSAFKITMEQDELVNEAFIECSKVEPRYNPQIGKPENFFYRHAKYAMKHCQINFEFFRRRRGGKKISVCSLDNNVEIDGSNFDASDKNDTMVLSYSNTISSTAPPVDEMAMYRERRKVLIKAIRSLPHHIAIVLYLKYYEMLTLVEIGATLDITKQAVQGRHDRGVFLLKKKLRHIMGDL